MPPVLRFGIHSLDELLGTHSGQPRAGGEVEQSPDRLCGINLLKEKDEKNGGLQKESSRKKNGDRQAAGGGAKETITTSICLIGPSGTGKSIFGLHMASRYLADCIRDDPDRRRLPVVLYVSTDLTYNMAWIAWNNFALNYPFSRKDPFSREPSEPPAAARGAGGERLELELKHIKPADLAKNFDLIENPKERGRVIFVDMASDTAGDDWGFLHKLLALLPRPEGDDPKHLVVVDAIEGFEALAGEVNAFGEKATRRSRVAQMMRLVEGKCHALLVVEKGGGEERLAEEFVADTVIRLENRSTRDYERRVLKVEKVRGQSHIRGHHHYSIRSGSGSTTGLQSNPDDPEVTAPTPAPGGEARLQSYVQVYHSVHRLNRKIMEIRGRRSKTRRGPGPDKFAAFGIKYLDNMLGGKAEETEPREATEETERGEVKRTGLYYDTRGLPCSTATAIIGDSLTQKSTLGKAFLSRCFHSFHDRLVERRGLLEEGERVKEIWGHIRERVRLLSREKVGPRSGPALPGRLGKAARPLSEREARRLIRNKAWWELSTRIGGEIGDAQMPFLSGLRKERARRNIASPASVESFTASLRGEKKLKFRPALKERLLTQLAAWTLDYRSGQAVMLVTHNTHHERLAEDFLGWLHTKEELDELDAEAMPGYRQALRDYIKGGTICRRLEIHNMSSEVLIHIVQQLISAAQRKVLTPEEMLRDDDRYKISWPIRVVIDDFSTLRDIFPELREDPLLLPSILFHFEREGVTTLIIDTQSGKPETPIAERFESELRQMVQHNLYTWRFPFYGESRVAITAIPPFSHEYAGIVRELRWESGTPGQQSSPSENEPATVDPHFELYTGLEEGRPQPVPLTVRFYAETPAMESYIETENYLFDELFVADARRSRTERASVIAGVPATNYNDLRDFAYLQRDTRLDHTLVFQVDEFWALRLPDQRKRSGTSHSQWPYLNAVTSKDREPDLNVDPYRLFQPREGRERKAEDRGREAEVRRRDFYKTYYGDYRDYGRFAEGGGKESLHVDRVPFTWDFGFLLCQERAWKTGRHIRHGVEGGDGKSPAWEYTVREVWESLKKATVGSAGERGEASARAQDDEGGGAQAGKIKYVSWRIFIEACKKAAEGLSDRLSKPVTAFDFAQISPESFSCLILEMWLSEIYDTLYKRVGEAQGEKKKEEARAKFNGFLGAVSQRSLFTPLHGGKQAADGKGDKQAAGGSYEKPALSLACLVKEYWRELYKSWLLLIEVINFSDIVGETTALDFDFKSKNTDFSAIASRHWYKTATQCPNEIAAKESLVAVRLPGHFSVRGDWFLAVSGSSRSVRQAERALDLLSSRRANVTRLQSGLGLPTRFSDSESVEKLRTRLISHERGQDNVEYETFLKIAETTEVAKNSLGEEDGFYWLWRSGLDDYVHCNRIWHKWLNRMLLSWYRNLLRYKSVWKSSFEIYDELTEKPPESIDKFAPTDEVWNEKMAEWESLKKESMEEYRKSVKEFLDEHGVDFLPQVKVRRSFRKLWETLTEELRQASEA